MDREEREEFARQYRHRVDRCESKVGPSNPWYHVRHHAVVTVLLDLICDLTERVDRMESAEPDPPPPDPPPFTPCTTERGFTVKPDPPPVEPDRWALHEQLDPARCFDECEPPRKFPWSIFQTTTHAKGCPVYLAMLYDHPNALLRKETGCRACWGRYQDGPGSELIITHSEHCPNS